MHNLLHVVAAVWAFSLAVGLVASLLGRWRIRRAIRRDREQPGECE
jgi:hypothetical protein